MGSSSDTLITRSLPRYKYDWKETIGKVHLQSVLISRLASQERKWVMTPMMSEKINDGKKTDSYRKVLKEEAIREKQAFDRVKETWRFRHRKLDHKNSNIYGKAAAYKREAEISEDSEGDMGDISAADYEQTNADGLADTYPEEQNQTEPGHWERIYVFRSSNDDQEQAVEQMNTSRSQFQRTLIRLEKLGSKVNAAAETYKVCYRKYGHNLDESMYYVDRFNEHINDTSDTVRSVLDHRPNEISQSDLNTAINGVDLELRKQAFDGLSPNYQLPESLLCCGLELELLRKVLEGNADYGNAESHSEAGKKARLEMLRKALKFRQAEETRSMNETAGSTVINVCTTEPSVDDFL